LKVAGETDLLLVVGTSGATSLPNQVVWEVKHRNGIIIDINIEKNPFSIIAVNSRQGFFIKQPSGETLPDMVQRFKAVME